MLSAEQDAQQSLIGAHRVGGVQGQGSVEALVRRRLGQRHLWPVPGQVTAGRGQVAAQGVHVCEVGRLRGGVPAGVGQVVVECGCEVVSQEQTDHPFPVAHQTAGDADVECVDPSTGGNRVGRVTYLVVVQLLAGQTRPGQRQRNLPVPSGGAAQVQHAQAAFSSCDQGEAGVLVIEVGVLGGARCDVVEQFVAEFLEHHAHRVPAPGAAGPRDGVARA